MYEQMGKHGANVRTHQSQGEEMYLMALGRDELLPGASSTLCLPYALGPRSVQL